MLILLDLMQPHIDKPPNLNLAQLKLLRIPVLEKHVFVTCSASGSRFHPHSLGSGMFISSRNFRLIAGLKKMFTKNILLGDRRCKS